VSDLVEIGRFYKAYQADLARMFLESRGVHAVVFDAGSSLYLDGALIPVRLMVLDEDFADAKVAMREYEA